MTKVIAPAPGSAWRAGLALEQPARLGLGSLWSRLAPGLRAASSAFLAPKFRLHYESLRGIVG